MQDITKIGVEMFLDKMVKELGMSERNAEDIFRCLIHEKDIQEYLFGETKKRGREYLMQLPKTKVKIKE